MDGENRIFFKLQVVKMQSKPEMGAKNGPAEQTQGTKKARFLAMSLS